MDKKYSQFQLILLTAFGVLALIGFVFFATFKPKQDDVKVVGKVVIWGTLDSDIVRPLLDFLTKDQKNLDTVQYIEKSKKTYEHELLEAIAAGSSPDLILVSNRDVFSAMNKIFILGSQTYTIRDFNDTFIDTFSIFTNSKGVIAIPFLIDPMVMYYNKDIFATNAFSLPPKTWENFFALAEKITELDRSGNIKKSAVAFGEANNILNFKDIIATMLLQAGDPIVYESKSGYQTTLEISKSNQVKKQNLSKILTYYTSFSNPNSKSYSWNRSLPWAEDFFLSGSLATYFGFVSDLKNIRLKNPNLNFDVAEIPTYQGSKNKTVFARVWGFAIPKAAKNKAGAFNVAMTLASEKSQEFLSEKMFLPPIRRSMLAKRHKDPFMDIFYREAIYAHSFIDPDYKETNKIFKYMINSVISNKNTPREAMDDAFKEIDLLLQSN